MSGIISSEASCIRKARIVVHKITQPHLSKMFVVTIVVIPDKPKWRQHALQKAVGTKGQTAILVCDVRAYPEVNFQWRLGGAEIQPGSKYRITHAQSHSTLEVLEVEASDRTQYQCVATNSEGLVFFYVEVLSPGKTQFLYLFRVGRGA